MAGRRREKRQRWGGSTAGRRSERQVGRGVEWQGGVSSRWAGGVSGKWGPREEAPAGKVEGSLEPADHGRRQRHERRPHGLQRKPVCTSPPQQPLLLPHHASPMPLGVQLLRQLGACLGFRVWGLGFSPCRLASSCSVSWVRVRVRARARVCVCAFVSWVGVFVCLCACVRVFEREREEGRVGGRKIHTHTHIEREYVRSLAHAAADQGEASRACARVWYRCTHEHAGNAVRMRTC